MDRPLAESDASSRVPSRKLTASARSTVVKELQDAARSAPDGATIEIDAKDYPGGVAEWRQNHLTVRGVGGRPHISADGKSVEERDVWLFSGNDVTVENVEVSGGRSRANKNGAAIRFISENLVLRHVYLHDSQNGVMAGNVVLQRSFKPRQLSKQD